MTSRDPDRELAGLFSLKPQSYQNTAPPMASLNLNYVLRGPLSEHSHMGGWGVGELAL